jgi:hypothetical protein
MVREKPSGWHRGFARQTSERSPGGQREGVAKMFSANALQRVSKSSEILAAGDINTFGGDDHAEGMLTV